MAILAKVRDDSAAVYERQLGHLRSADGLYQPTAAALHTARALLYGFDVKKGRIEVEPTERNLAITVDLCTVLHKLLPYLDAVLDKLPKLLHSGAKDVEIQMANRLLLELQNARNYMPSFNSRR